MQRLIELFRNESEVEALLERVSRHPADTFYEQLGVANLQPGLIFVQPRTGFQVASVHSIAERSLIVG